MSMAVVRSVALLLDDPAVEFQHMLLGDYVNCVRLARGIFQ